MKHAAAAAAAVAGCACQHRTCRRRRGFTAAADSSKNAVAESLACNRRLRLFTLFCGCKFFLPLTLTVDRCALAVFEFKPSGLVSGSRNLLLNCAFETAAFSLLPSSHISSHFHVPSLPRNGHFLQYQDVCRSAVTSLSGTADLRMKHFVCFPHKRSPSSDDDSYKFTL